jgi:predicted membrane-bound spermidine synthase
MLSVLTLVFIVSGAAGLIYESIWSRYLSLFVGHSAYAQIIVLVIFLGGMSLGALAVGDRSERLKRPLLWYVAVEAAVGVIGFGFNDLYVVVSDFAYDTLFPALAGGWALTVVKWLIASLLILPQSILLGTTFPLMTAGAIRLAKHAPGRLLGLLYFANSFGAAGGVLLAGFFLLNRVGLPGTLETAAWLNFVVAACVALALVARSQLARLSRVPAARDANTESRTETAVSAPPQPTLPTAPGLVNALLLVSFGTAVASFIYEIAWIRMLSLVLGSATHSFELMLSAFILGLALGALWIRRRADRLGDAVGVLGLVQWVMGTLAIATLPLYVASFGWVGTLLDTFKQSDAGYTGFLIARYAICLVIMLPATFCAGITLPLITRILMHSEGRVRGERAIGAVYGLNTLGSIVGVLLAGLVLMPLLGLKLLLVSGAVVDIALGLLLLGIRARAVPMAAPRFSVPVFAAHPAGRLTALTAATGAMVVFTTATVEFDRARLTSGVYRYAVVPRAGDFTIPFYRDGRTATVSIRRTRSGFTTLATNGKPDASMDAFWRDTTRKQAVQHQLERDLATQMLLPVITLAHNPRARDVAVIGQGSGMTSHVLLGSPAVRELATIEIEPEMIQASRAFLPVNRRVFEDRRAHFVLDDAKSYFAASGRKFDLILSEPSNPWVSGVSGLFTTEFYRRVRSHLSPGGVFGHWLHLYELDDRLATTVLAALDRNFPSYDVFFTSNADILIVAGTRSSLPKPEWRVVDFPGIAEDLRRAIPLTPEALEATRLATRDLLHPYLSAFSSPNSDFYPLLDLGAERTRYLKKNAEGVSSFGEGRFNIPAALTGHRQGFGTVPVAVTPEINRVSELALGVRVRMIAKVAKQSDRDRAVSGDAELARALTRLDVLERGLKSNDPPMDWKIWVDDVREAERIVHGGTAGVADTVFYSKLRDYVARVHAPAPVVSSIDFLHGLASWNFEEVSRAADILMETKTRDSVDWLPAGFVRNAAVVARMKLGDFGGARKVFATYIGNSDQTRFIALVLWSYLLDQERRRGE